MQSRTLAVAAVVAVALAALGAAGAVAAGGQSTADAPNKTIQVSASGQIQTQADRAVVRVAVVTTGDDIGTVREQLATNSSSMRDALAEMGVDAGQVQTVHYDISSEERDGRSRGEEGPKYRAIHAFAITVNDTDSVGEVIDTAVNSGASEIDGVEFTLSADKRADLKEQALQQAMDTARGKAGAIASRADLTVAGVDSVQTSRYSATPYRTEVAHAGDGSTDIDSGPVTVSASVSVVYEAQPTGT